MKGGRGYYFIPLATIKQLRDFISTELPINDQVVTRVNDLSTKERQPEMTKGYPIFYWSPGIPITNKDDKTKIEEDEIASTHKDKHDYDITKNGE